MRQGHDVVTTPGIAPPGTRSDFAADVRYYLTLEPRQLPSRYLYDALGSALFEAITHLPWYPLARAEARLLRRHARDVFAAVPETSTLLELGPGGGDKLLALVEAAGRRRRGLHVRLVDVSPAALALAARSLAAACETIVCYEETFEGGLDRFRRDARAPGRTLALFLGSNIGNFDPPGCDALLRAVRAALAPGDALLLGADLVKPERDLLLAYDDPLGITAAFNRNLLLRVNRELDGTFDIDAFAHRAVWNAARSRVELHLVSRRAQTVHIRGAALRLSLAEGETIWTESSYKYHPDELGALLERAGFRMAAQWIDAADLFALTLACVA